MECRGFRRGLCSCGGVLPKVDFMEKLVTIREICGFPFIITSGARCKVYNAKVGGSVTESAHVLGLAADISVYGNYAARLISVATGHGMLGIGIQQKSGLEYRERFIHLDREQREWTKPGECWLWSY